MRALAESTWIRMTQPRKLSCAKPSIAIGGSALGGTGKTPLAIAIAEYLAPRTRVAIVGHAYRAKPGHARIVRLDDPIAEVGDEALVCARRATVVVGPTRQSAINLACEIADVVILDGVLQLSPPAALSILTVLEAGAPSWLERHADVVVRVESTIDLSGLVGRPVGLVTCLARPERLVRALESHGVHVALHRAFRNHGPAGSLRSSSAAPPRRGNGEFEVWVATEKCALHLEANVHVLAQQVALSTALRARLDRLSPPPYSEIPRT